VNNEAKLLMIMEATMSKARMVNIFWLRVDFFRFMRQLYVGRF